MLASHVSYDTASDIMYLQTDETKRNDGETMSLVLTLGTKGLSISRLAGAFPVEVHKPQLQLRDPFGTLFKGIS